MKRYIIPIIVVILVLAAVAASLFLVDKLFYRPEEETISQSETVAAERIRQISVDIPVGYVSIFEKSSGDNITIDYVGITNDFYKIEVTNDGKTLDISGEELRWYDQMRYSTADKYGITIGIPEGYNGGIDIETDIGNVTVKDLSVLTAEVSADVGNVSLTSVTAHDQINISVDTGNATLNDITVSTGIICKVDIGNIEFSELHDTDPSSLGFGVFMTCDVGSIDGSLPLSRENYTLTASSDTGAAPENFKLGNIKLEFTVDVGDIKVSFAD